MKDRGKRRKIAQSDLVSVRPRSGRCVGICSSSQGGFRADENCSGSAGDRSTFDSGAFASRCSVNLINEVVSKFDEVKIELVKSTGFDGLLHFPPMKQINRKFSLWLMRGVDEVHSSLNVGDHIRLPFNKFDVGHVFGIPVSGKPVIDTSADQRDAKEKVVAQFLGREFLEQRSVKIAQAILEREYSSPMSEDDVNRFKVAFVVFVVSNLLCPSAKFDYAAVDYWNAIQNPDEICLYDWAGYVITRLLEAVGKLRQDISNNLKTPIITGCSIFLQVLYLDSIDIDGLSLPHNMLPRIRAFPFDHIRSMILADHNYARHCKADSSIPIGKLRDAARCLYSWAERPPDVSDECRSTSMIALWESTVAMVRLVGIPLEAAGPLFIALAEFQDEVNDGLSVCGIRALKFISVMASLMMPYAQGYRGNLSPIGSGRIHDNGTVRDAISNGTRTLSILSCSNVSKSCQPTPFSGKKDDLLFSQSVVEPYREGSSEVSSSAGLVLEKRWVRGSRKRLDTTASGCETGSRKFNDVPTCVARTMARFYSVLRNVNAVRNIDLNASTSVDMEANSLMDCVEEPRWVELPSPWDLGYHWWPKTPCRQELWLELAKLKNDERCYRNAIVHRDPKYIQVGFGELYTQLSSSCEMEPDVFDVILRVAKMEDDLLYTVYGSARWRLFFESDFMGSILTGNLDLADPMLHYHLCLHSVVYDISKVRIVFMPALLQCQWICFAWQPDENIILAFDPCVAGGRIEARVGLVERCFFLIKMALRNLCNTVFVRCNRDVTQSELCIMNVPDTQVSRRNCTGLWCSLFYRLFDGFQIVTNNREVYIKDVGTKFLEDLWGWDANNGALSIRDQGG